MQLARAATTDSGFISLAQQITGAFRHSGAGSNVVFAFLVRIASAVILYISQIVLARWMGDFEYGIYVVVWTWVLLLGGLSTLGLSTAMMRLLPEQREQGTFDLMRGLLLGGRVVPIVFSATVAIAGWLMLRLLGNAMDSHYLLPAYLALVCLPLITLTDLQDGIGRANEWVGVALLPPYVIRPLAVLAAVIAAHEVGLEMSAPTAVSAAILAAAAAAIVQTLFLRRRLRSTVPQGPRTVALRPWFKMCLPLLLISGCEVLMQNVDVLVISHYLAPNDIAIYFAATKTMSVVLFVHFAVGSAFANRFASLNARGDQLGLKSAIRQAVNWTFWPSLAVAAAILALGRPALWLFGPQFTAGYGLMAILAVGYLAKAATGPSEFVLNMLGQQKACAAGLATTVALNLTLCVLLVPLFGPAGAAIATATAWTASAALNTILARRHLGVDLAIWSNLPICRGAWRPA
ncbi:MAG: lipopolysaccharide biosynthesis protein [Hyphomicrobiaceae bacterium]